MIALNRQFTLDNFNDLGDSVSYWHDDMAVLALDKVIANPISNPGPFRHN